MVNVFDFVHSLFIFWGGGPISASLSEFDLQRFQTTKEEQAARL